jgi:hypothetical protein
MKFFKPSEFVEFVAEMKAPCVTHTVQVGRAVNNGYRYHQSEKYKTLDIVTGAIIVVGARETVIQVHLSPAMIIPEGWALIEGKRLFRREERKMDMIQVLLDAGVPKETLTAMRKTKVSTLREVCDNSLTKQRTNEETLTISELVEKVTTKGTVETIESSEFGEITIEVTPSSHGSGLVFDFFVDWTEKVDVWIAELQTAMAGVDLELYDGVIDDRL